MSLPEQPDNYRIEDREDDWTVGTFANAGQIFVELVIPPQEVVRDDPYNI